MTVQDGRDRRLGSVVRVFDIVEHLRAVECDGVTNIAESVGAAKSTVHAHLATLESKGYVVREGEEYRLGIRFLTLGEHVRAAEPLAQAARRPVEDLAEETGEHVVAMTIQHGLGTVVHVGEGDRSVPSDITVGTPVYLHCSAGGKAVLATYPRDRVDGVVDRWGLPAFTDATITDRESLHEELADVRESGVATNREEYLDGVVALGTAVHAPDGTVEGAITLSGPARRLFGCGREADLRDSLLASANAIEVNLMFHS
ncbi:IclR family transcriptional regulator [Halomarina litorea]|uniref:IclR family transcriptional regulator n=1 Tax=Halomarina litorea TaxID=2961595 RepID=UPI0020C26D66|nr:IclR family transcriptional regulator [Halomarina sp. BCD28]